MNNQMNYSLYRTKVIAGEYPAGKEVEAEFAELLEKEDSRLYRVAVVGEFKRGKSSLINTLLGTEILPTDILPTTAVVNKIVYDAEQSIVINYKDGSSEETTIEKLKDYATKLDDEKEKLALTISDITVKFPSVLGQNRIEIIDTPGLNDDEVMSEKTFEVLDKIDTAIVVISATMPLSATEQRLIMDLIAQPKIYHLTFVISFIDRLDEEDGEVEEMIQQITARLEKNTYDLFKSSYGGNADLMKKADDILKEPAIFAVSSKFAMNGILKNDMKLLEKSRFPMFKKKLLARLIGTQELDIKNNSERLFKLAKEQFPIWRASKLNAMKSTVSSMESQLAAIMNISERSSDLFKHDTDSAYIKLADAGIMRDGSAGIFMNKAELIPTVVKKLSSIKRSTYNDDTVKNAIIEATSECSAKALKAQNEIKALFEGIKAEIIEKAAKYDTVCGISAESLPSFDEAFPEICIDEALMLESAGSLDGNVMSGIREYLNMSCENFCKAVLSHVFDGFFAVIQKHSRNTAAYAKEYGAQLADIIKMNRKAISDFINDADAHEKEICSFAVQYAQGE